MSLVVEINDRTGSGLERGIARSSHVSTRDVLRRGSLKSRRRNPICRLGTRVRSDALKIGFAVVELARIERLNIVVADFSRKVS